MKTQLRETIIATGMRGSIERILDGDVRVQDLHTLFFSMRQEAGGKGIVSEIAHFVAHPRNLELKESPGMNCAASIPS